MARVQERNLEGSILAILARATDGKATSSGIGILTGASAEDVAHALRHLQDRCRIVYYHTDEGRYWMAA